MVTPVHSAAEGEFLLAEIAMKACQIEAAKYRATPHEALGYVYLKINHLAHRKDLRKPLKYLAGRTAHLEARRYFASNRHLLRNL